MAFHSVILEETRGRARSGARGRPPCRPIDRSLASEGEEEEEEEERVEEVEEKEESDGDDCMSFCWNLDEEEERGGDINVASATPAGL